MGFLGSWVPISQMRGVFIGQLPTESLSRMTVPYLHGKVGGSIQKGQKKERLLSIFSSGDCLVGNC
jgi:hypothetical protein